MANLLRAIQCICIMLFICLGVFAGTIHIPGDSSTIQAGINGATDGDTVLVADGVYYGYGNYGISFNGKQVLLMSENGPDYTIIECSFDSLN